MQEKENLIDASKCETLQNQNAVDYISKLRQNSKPQMAMPDNSDPNARIHPRHA